jgi:hypothetical protein
MSSNSFSKFDLTASSILSELTNQLFCSISLNQKSKILLVNSFINLPKHYHKHLVLSLMGGLIMSI